MSLLSILTNTTRMLLLSPAQFILRLVIAVFLPVIIIGNYLTSLVFGMLSLPFVVFSRLQELYVFCGVAAVIGISAGAILGLASYFLTDTLDFSNEPAAPRALGQTRPKNERIRSAAKNITTTATTNTKLPARVLFPQVIPTILEEEDEDSPFLVSGGGGGKKRAGKVKRVTGWSSEEEEDESSGY